MKRCFAHNLETRGRIVQGPIAADPIPVRIVALPFSAPLHAPMFLKNAAPFFLR
jgi:hypothetical protein